MPVSPPVSAPAGIPRRLLAYVIDGLVYLIAGGGILLGAALLDRGLIVGNIEQGTGAVLIAGVGVLGVGAFQCWLEGTRGFTVGKYVLGLRTRSARTQQPLGMVGAVLRTLVLCAGLLAFGVGQIALFFSVILDASGSRQGWHDKIVGAVVVSSGAAGAPEPTWHPVRPEGHVRLTRPSEPARIPLGFAAPVSEAAVVARPAITHVPAQFRAQEPAQYPALADDVEMTRVTIDDPVSRRTAATRHAASTVRSATLELSDGRRIPLVGRVLIGRDPAPRAGELYPDQLIRVDDPKRSVSKTQLVIGLDAEGVWLRDRSSTNGTLVTLVDGQRVLCIAEQPVRVPIGTSVAFGDLWLVIAD